MKQGLKWTGLAVGNLVATAVFGVAAMGLMFSMFAVGTVLAVLLLCGCLVLSERIWKWCQNRWKLRPILFLLLTKLPSLVVGGIGMYAVARLSESGYWAGEWFGGLTETLFFMGLTAAGGAMLGGTLLVWLCRYLKKRYDAREDR